MNEIEYLQDLAGVQLTEIIVEYGEILEEQPTETSKEDTLKVNDFLIKVKD